MSVTTTVFTKELTNSTLEITENMGVIALSVLNKSSVNGTVIGTAKLLGVESGAITLAQNESASFASIGNINGVLVGITITAPSGCTLTITAQK
jgi:hypothetical protein